MRGRLKNHYAGQKATMSKLIEACKGIDVFYKEWCDNLDIEHGDPVGSVYKNGINLEFEIEADWWHDVSLALREFTA